MIRIEFTTKSISDLQYERYHHPHPKVQVKMEALLLKSKDVPHKEICRVPPHLTVDGRNLPFPCLRKAKDKVMQNAQDY